MKPTQVDALYGQIMYQLTVAEREALLSRLLRRPKCVRCGRDEFETMERWDDGTLSVTTSRRCTHCLETYPETPKNLPKSQKYTQLYMNSCGEIVNDEGVVLGIRLSDVTVLHPVEEKG